MALKRLATPLALIFAIVFICVAPTKALAVVPDVPAPGEVQAAGQDSPNGEDTVQQGASGADVPGQVNQTGKDTASDVSDQQAGQGQQGPSTPKDDGEEGDELAQPSEQGAAEPGAPVDSAEANEALPAASLKQSTTNTAKADPSITYKAHVQNVGWQGAVSNGQVAGTSGRALRMEALTVTLNTGGYTGGLQMKAHVQNVGWQSIAGNGSTMGTTGRSLRVEALRIALTGELSQYYDIYYCAHVQNVGWQGWVSNGAIAGTTGRGLRIEALKIELRKKTTPAATQSDGVVGVRYQTHVQNVGWQDAVADGMSAGTTGRGLRAEAVRIWLEAGTLSGAIEYRVHVQNKGWLKWVKNGAVAGTTGAGLRLEALEIRLTGDIASKYDVVYQTHVQNVGWQPVKNNQRDAGTTGQGLRVEALQIRVVSKAQRNGWFNDTGTWNFYISGSKAAGRWIVTEESPIDAHPGMQRYWIDTSGNLAISRVIRPSNAGDSGSYFSLATGSGYVKRNVIVELENQFYWANNDGLLTTPDVSAMIENAVKWAINTANDDSHGYSQAVRWGPDYDCSSFVIQAFKSAGFNVGNAVYTGNMISEMTQHGFAWSTNLANLRRGDIVLVHSDYRQHTELYLGNGQLVGAHISETGGITGRAGDQTGREISVGSYYDAPWQGFLRAVLK